MWHFGFETSWFRDFSNFFDGIGFGIEELELDLKAECGISVSKFLGFKTFSILWMVSDLV